MRGVNEMEKCHNEISAMTRTTRHFQAREICLDAATPIQKERFVHPDYVKLTSRASASLYGGSVYVQVCR